MGRQEKALDPAAGPVAEFALALRKLRQDAGSPTYAAMARRSPYSVATLSRAAAGEQLPTLPVVLAYVAACGGTPEACAEFEARWRRVDDPPEGAQPGPTGAGEGEGEGHERSPYRGLARFEPGDRELFFGRDRVLADVLALLRDHRVVTVFGASGSGKSSLLRAGLVPYLRAPDDGALERPAAIRLLTPGEHPLGTHGSALLPAEAEGDTWLIVDQFEELFTLCHDAQERDGFIGGLLRAADPAARLRVVLGVRADFYARCLDHPGLAAAVRDASLPIGRMTPAELRAVIVKPAAARGLIVERALTETLVEEVSARGSGLPMLSHALLETWRRRRGRTLTLDAYERAGGMSGAIAQTAEAAYGRMDPDQAETVRRVMLRLITPGDGVPDTRRPTTRTELESLGTGSAPVLELLARERLITLDEDRADLAHEALITAWPRLRGWIEESREKLRLHRWLTEAAHAWDSAGRDRGIRISPAHLSRLAEFTAQPGSGDLTALEAAFLDAATATHRRTRRNRLAARTVIALLTALSLLVGTAAWEQRRADDQRKLRTAALRTVALAERLRASDPVTAGRLGIAAWELDRTTETRAALLGARTHRRDPDFNPAGPEYQGLGGLLSRDARTLTLQRKDRLEQWDIATRRRTATPILPRAPSPKPNIGLEPPRSTSWLDLSPDGKRAVSARAAERRSETVLPGEVHVWDLESGARRTLKPPGVNVSFHSMSWAADSGTLAWNVDGTVEVWDTAGARRVFAAEGHKRARSAALSPDGGRIALCGSDGLIQVWSVPEQRRIGLDLDPDLDPDPDPALSVDPEECDGGGRLAFAPDGRLLAVRLESGLRVIDTAAGASSWFSESGLTEFAFSADSTLIGALKRDSLALWRTGLPLPGATESDGVPPVPPVFTLDLPNETPSQLALDTEQGKLRYLRADERTVATVDIGALREPQWSPEPLETEFASPDGRYAVRARGDGDAVRFDLYDLRTDAHLATLPALARSSAGPGDGQEPPTGGFSPDGRLFAYGPSPWEHGDGPVRVRVFDTDRRRALAQYELAGESLSPDVLAPFLVDGKATVYAVNRTGLWELASGRQLADVSSHPTLAVAPDASLAVLGDGSVLALPDGKPVRRLTATGDILAARFSPDGRTLATTDRTGLVTVWNGTAQRRVGVLSPAQGPAPSSRSSPVLALGYSSDSGTFATGDHLGRVRLWDLASLSPLGEPLPTPGDSVREVAFSSNGATLRTQGNHTPVRTHALDPAALVASLCTSLGGGPTRTEWEDHIPDVPYRSTCG
ncbi:hypothetical protein OHA37_38925 [Streptomyces sp. NBC_00335]|uniref:nSTAND1 domain-containing NTPase n=2 Tax=unclassified Streptomyces TaxID=2593676 RepID=UPI002252A0A0|nr:MULTISPECIES: hypothetical protein [unclassified Streptomyces]MCX5409809.1 hypothetical protein [Streptomyces sp. NBC_00086]